MFTKGNFCFNIDWEKGDECFASYFRMSILTLAMASVKAKSVPAYICPGLSGISVDCNSFMCFQDKKLDLSQDNCTYCWLNAIREFYQRH